MAPSLWGNHGLTAASPAMIAWGTGYLSLGDPRAAEARRLRCRLMCRHGGAKPSALVGERFRKVGLSGPEPLTSALSGGPAPHEVRNRRRVDVRGRPSLSVAQCGGSLPDWLRAKGAAAVATTSAVVDRME